MTWAKVGDICRLVNGKAFKPSDWGSSGAPIIRIQNLNDAEKPFNYWSGALDRQVKVQTGDVLLAWSGTPGTSFGVHIWNRGSGILNQHIFRVDLDQTKITRRWFMHAVNGQLSKLIAQAHGGVGLQHVTRPMVDGLEIPLPSLDEQQRITSILDKADALRGKRKRAIELLDSLTGAIFLEMFGDLVESYAYPRGVISDWVADFDTGKNLAPDPDSRKINGYRVLKVSAVTKGVFLPDESKPLPVGYVPPASHIVKEGDLLFSRANTTELIGATAYVESAQKKIVLPDKIWRFVWRRTNSPNPRFVHALFSTPSFRRALAKRATGTSGSMKNISKTKVLGIEIALPTRERQDEFAVRYLAIQRNMSIAILQSALLEDQFSSLQFSAFSGQL